MQVSTLEYRLWNNGKVSLTVTAPAPSSILADRVRHAPNTFTFYYNSDQFINEATAEDLRGNEQGKLAANVDPLSPQGCIALAPAGKPPIFYRIVVKQAKATSLIASNPYGWTTLPAYYVVVPDSDNLHIFPDAERGFVVVLPHAPQSGSNLVRSSNTKHEEVVTQRNGSHSGLDDSEFECTITGETAIPGDGLMGYNDLDQLVPVPGVQVLPFSASGNYVDWSESAVNEAATGHDTLVETAPQPQSGASGLAVSSVYAQDARWSPSGAGAIPQYETRDSHFVLQFPELGEQARKAVSDASRYQEEHQIIDLRKGVRVIGSDLLVREISP
jgi:hypothetical protein